MNIIFLDFDGVLHGGHDYLADAKSLIYKRILILADIVKTYDCKIVIEASAKDAIDEETLETDVDWINEYFQIFNSLGIEVIGRTPSCERKVSRYVIMPMWKEDEIITYLLNHPEIEHFCVIDDDDLNVMHRTSDLDKLRGYLVTPVYFADSKDPNEEGLLPKHKTEVGKILQKENIYREIPIKTR